jgi:hypothetical protein
MEDKEFLTVFAKKEAADKLLDGLNDYCMSDDELNSILLKIFELVRTDCLGMNSQADIQENIQIYLKIKSRLNTFTQDILASDLMLRNIEKIVSEINAKIESLETIKVKDATHQYASNNDFKVFILLCIMPVFLWPYVYDYFKWPRELRVEPKKSWVTRSRRYTIGVGLLLIVSALVFLKKSVQHYFFGYQ